MRIRYKKTLITAGVAGVVWGAYNNKHFFMNLMIPYRFVKLRAQSVIDAVDLIEASKQLLTLEQYLTFWKELPEEKLKEMLNTPEEVAALLAQVNLYVTNCYVSWYDEPWRFTPVSVSRDIKRLHYALDVERQILGIILSAYITEKKPAIEDLSRILTLANTIKHYEEGSKQRLDSLLDKEHWFWFKDLSIFKVSFQARVVEAYLALSWVYPVLKDLDSIEKINSFLKNKELLTDAKEIIMRHPISIKHFLKTVNNNAELMSLFNIYDFALRRELILGILDPNDSHAIQVIKDANYNLPQMSALLEIFYHYTNANDKMGDAQKYLLIALGDHPYIKLLTANIETLHQQNALSPASMHYLNRLLHGEKPISLSSDATKPLSLPRTRCLLGQVVETVCAPKPPIHHDEYCDRLHATSTKQSEFDQLLALFGEFRSIDEYASLWNRLPRKELESLLCSPERCAELLHRIDDTFNRWYANSIEYKYTSSLPLLTPRFSYRNTVYYNILNQQFADNKRGRMIDDVLDIFIKYHLRSQADLDHFLSSLSLSTFKPIPVSLADDLPQLDLYQGGIRQIVLTRLLSRLSKDALLNYLCGEERKRELTGSSFGLFHGVDKRVEAQDSVYTKKV